MKKVIVSLSLILVILVGMVGRVSAANGKITLETTNPQPNKNAQVIINVKLSDITTTKGAAAFSATLEYDKDSLKLDKIEGQNGWSTAPTYNETNGKIAMSKGSNVTGAENILKLTFTVKENAKQNLVVTLKDTTFSESVEDIEIPRSYIRLTVKNGASNPVPNPGTDANTTGNNNTVGNNQTGNGTNSNKLNVIGSQNNTVSNNTTASGNLPQTGVSNVAIPVAIGVAIVIAAVAVVRLRMMK